jgi:hypothetical protein
MRASTSVETPRGGPYDSRVPLAGTFFNYPVTDLLALWSSEGRNWYQPWNNEQTHSRSAFSIHQLGYRVPKLCD